MLAEDCRETNHCSIRMSNSAYLTGNIFFCDSRTDELHSCGVHLISDNRSTLQFFNFLWSLGRTHLDNSLDEIHAGFLFLLVWMNAEEVEYLKLDVVAVRWQEVDLAFLRHGIVTDGLQALHWRRIMYAHLLCEIVDAIYASVPYNIYQVDIITD